MTTAALNKYHFIAITEALQSWNDVHVGMFADTQLSLEEAVRDQEFLKVKELADECRDSQAQVNASARLLANVDTWMKALDPIRVLHVDIDTVMLQRCRFPLMGAIECYIDMRIDSIPDSLDNSPRCLMGDGIELIAYTRAALAIVQNQIREQAQLISAAHDILHYIS